MNELDVIWRRFELLRMKWRIENRNTCPEEAVRDAALNWIEVELNTLEVAA